MTLEQIESAIASTKGRIAEIGEIARLDSIRTSTAKRFVPDHGAIAAQKELPSLNAHLAELEAAKTKFLIQESPSTKTSSQMQVSTPIMQKDSRPQIISNNVTEKNNTNWILIAIAFVAVIFFGVMK